MRHSPFCPRRWPAPRATRSASGPSATSLRCDWGGIYDRQERRHQARIDMPLRIAIAAWNAGSVIDPAAAGVIGGLETSAWLLARALAAQDGFQVTLVLRHTRLLPAESAGVAIAPVIEPLRQVRLSVSSA